MVALVSAGLPLIFQNTGIVCRPKLSGSMRAETVPGLRPITTGAEIILRQRTADTAVIDSNAVWWHNFTGVTERVRTKLPNARGLYDMIGNVQEYCNDWYGNYSSGSQTDPTGPSIGGYRVLRGGACYNLDNYMRSAARAVDRPGHRLLFGFRCVRR